MTRRKVIFWNDLNDSYIVSEEYNGDKAEMERFGLGACDHTWPEFMEAMSSVSNMADFLKVISYITASYHATVNGVPLPEQANNLPGSRLNVAHSHKELYNLVGDMDEVWEVKRNISGAHLLDVSTIAPKPKQVWDGKEVIDEDDFDYATAKPGDFVTQAVVDNAMDCLPPVCMSARCSQMGEPYSSKLDEKTGEWRSIYATFRKVGGEWPNGIWEYCGHCFRGETVERGKEMAHKAKWVCECKCGNIVSVLSDSLRNGKTRSCGCARSQIKHDLTNQTFGFLKVIEPVKNERIKGNETRWKCLCQNCGRTVEVSSYWLRHSDPYGHCKCTRFNKPL